MYAIIIVIFFYRQRILEKQKLKEGTIFTLYTQPFLVAFNIMYAYYILTYRVYINIVMLYFINGYM